MQTKHCVECQSELPLDALHFDRDNNAPDGFRRECKVCRSEKRHKERQEHAIAKVQEMDRRAMAMIMGTLDQGGSRIPHIAELCECVTEVFGGPRGYAEFLLGEFLSHKPGSPARVKILGQIQYLVQKTTETGAARKSLEGLEEEDIAREAAELIERRDLRIAQQTKEQDVA